MCVTRVILHQNASRKKQTQQPVTCEFLPRFAELSHQVVEFRVLAEEGFALFLLIADKVLNVDIKACRGNAFRAQCGLFTLLKQQGQQREQGMSVKVPTHMHTVLLKSLSDMTCGGSPENWVRTFSVV